MGGRPDSEMVIIAHSNRMTTIEFPSTATSTAITAPILTPQPSVDTSAPVLPPVKIDRGWHADPFDQHDLRFHDGSDWTEHVTHLGPVPCRGCNPYAR